MMSCTETLFENLWATFPEAKVGQYNYDVGCMRDTLFYGKCAGSNEEFLGGAYCTKSDDSISCAGRAL
jgi:hypothetical protein